MRARALLPLTFVALLLAAAPSQAALSRPHAFALEDEFAPYGTADTVAFASGALTARLPASTAAHAFFNATLRIDGLQHLCWGYDDPLTQCADGGNLSLRVLGGGVGLRFPGNVSAQVQARQAVAMFIDLGEDAAHEDLGLDRVLVAPVLGGEVRFGPVPPIPDLNITIDFDPEAHKRDVGLLATLDRAGHVEVLRAGEPIHTVRGKDHVLSFTGEPRPGPVRADTLVLAFPDGSEADFRPASAADARLGLDACRIDAALRSLGDGAAEDASDADCAPVAADVQALMTEILNGAIVLVPVPENQTQVDLGAISDGVLVRFRGMTTTAAAGALSHTGSAMLQIEGGRVQGTPVLYGVWLVQMPWWAWLLWGLAAAALVARIATKAPKKNEKWDRFWWVGYVAGALAFVVVLWLWDREIAAALGTSAFTTAASGAGRWTILAVEVAAFAFLSAFFIAPLSMLFRNVGMLAGQGKFMNLSIPAGLLVGFLAGAYLVRAYLGLLLAQLPG